MRAEFTIPGECVGKQRPKFARRGSFVTTYTPEQTATYENLVKVEYERQCGVRFPDGEPLAMYFDAYFAIPQSASKKKRALMLSGQIRPTKKDIDNLVKCVADGLHDVCYKNDNVISELYATKRYADNPCTKVFICTLDELRKD